MYIHISVMKSHKEEVSIYEVYYNYEDNDYIALSQGGYLFYLAVKEN